MEWTHDCNGMKTFYGYDALRLLWLFSLRLFSTMMFNFTTHTYAVGRFLGYGKSNKIV